MYKIKRSQNEAKRVVFFCFSFDFWQLKATLGLSQKPRIQGLNTDLQKLKKRKSLELNRVCVQEESVLHCPINANGKKRIKLAGTRSLRTHVQYATKNRHFRGEEGPVTPSPDL